MRVARWMSVLLLVVQFAYFGRSAPGATHREWKTATLVAAERRDDAPEMERKRDTTASTDIFGDDHVTSTTTVRPSGLQQLWMYYTIRSEKTVYVTRIRVNLPWTKRITAEPGAAVQYAIAGDRLYVLNSDGGEAKSEIVATHVAGAAAAAPLRSPSIDDHAIVSGTHSAQSSCRVGDTTYCSGCAVSCVLGKEAKCSVGSDSPSGPRCFRQADCQCF